MPYIACFDAAVLVSALSTVENTALPQSYGALDEAALAVVAVQVLRFLKCCHDQGVVYGEHREALIGWAGAVNARSIFLKVTHLCCPPCLPVVVLSAFPGDVKPANFCLNKAAQGDSRACSRPILTQLKTVDFGSAQQLPGVCTEGWCYMVCGSRRSWTAAPNQRAARICLAGEGRLSSLIGTFAFLAPECYAQNYGLKADMWSLGVMLYW